MSSSQPTPPCLRPGQDEAGGACSASPLLPSASELRADGTRHHDKELEAFRQAWRDEVQRRGPEHPSPPAGSSRLPRLRIPAAQGNAPQPHHPRPPRSDGEEEGGGTAASAAASDEEAAPHSPSSTRHLLRLAEDQRRAALQAAEDEGSPLPAQVRGGPCQKLRQDAPTHASASKKSQMKAAVEAYALGAEMERRGHFDQATYHYRRAFRLDLAPDKLYERAKSLLQQRGLLMQGRPAGQMVFSPWDAQADALLARSEVGEMIRRAADVDDSRVVAMEKREQEECRRRAAGCQHLPRHPEPKGVLDDLDAGLSIEEDDQLEDIIAKSSTAVEGRDLSRISFKSRPTSVRISHKAKSSESEADQVVDDEVAEKLEMTHVKAEEEEGPPPSIARLPDEILAHICRMVIEPRGVRGEKIRPPRVEAVTDKQGHHSEAKLYQQADQERGQARLSSESSNATARSGKGPTGVGVVLAGADWQSLEMLARVSWKWRLASRTKGLWRLIIGEAYRNPQLPLPLSPSKLPNPRLLFIHHPRIRETGCYIAACHYTRPGLNVENPWVRVTHLVEFYRSIRFLPDGKALTFLTTDPPKETVGRMYTGNTDKGFAVGRWRVELTAPEAADGLEKAEELGEREKRRRKGGARVIIEDLKDRHMAKYAFRIVLSLRSTSRGKWNKMEMLEYCSINLQTGEVLALPQKHNRPFHFSSVRSYGV